jgi:F-type H+-transporting ATPase subunit alpha
MLDFERYLEATGEVGEVVEVIDSMVYAKGLPRVKPAELVVFENGSFGQTFSLTHDYIEILLFSSDGMKPGIRVARTNDFLKVPVGNHLLGKVIGPLTKNSGGEVRLVDSEPPSIFARVPAREPFETGVAIVDLVEPLAIGQRELVIGDRRTGKTVFLLQTILNQARKGTICVYAAIGKKKVDVRKAEEFFLAHGVDKKIVIVATSSADPAGLIFQTPYTAMTVAEYFRDQGKDVLVILDDLTTHAKFYREISLLARRFPGRSSYPGDIFFTHSKLLERAGNFKNSAITCLPVAETVLGDLSGYIQTNLMAMTDGHIFFDTELANLGRRPAINPFLSVTRVGGQAQTPLLKEASRELSKFLVHHKKLQEFMHFGAELSEEVKRDLNLGERITALFDQKPSTLFPQNVSLILFTGVWAGLGREMEIRDFKKQIEAVTNAYLQNAAFQKNIDALISSSKTFADLISLVKKNSKLLTNG